MNKILVAVFDTETAAYEGLSALKELNASGDITLNATAVIAKSADGTLGLLWEREMQGLYFTRIPLEWIDAAKI